jgi:hypothetical protein
MSGFGDFDFSALKEFKGQLDRMQAAWPAFLDECIRELAARLLAKVVPRTPVDKGELRRGWTIGQIVRTPTGVEVEVINPVEYAPYVEFGHRTRNHTGWVEGRFMLTISEDELQRELPAILNRKLQQFLNRFI